jgi:hypothetical protein
MPPLRLHDKQYCGQDSRALMKGIGTHRTCMGVWEKQGRGYN